MRAAARWLLVLAVIAWCAGQWVTAVGVAQ